MKKIAVILGGCGTKDGSEINETVTLLLALDQHGVKYQCFAPDREQYQVINHLTGEVVNEKRNMIVESARIVRGEILPLTEFNADDYDGLAIPGGAGIANNLFTYFTDGMQMTVLPEVKDAIVATHKQNKPIAAMCIAPVVVAKVLGKYNIKVTIGNDKQVADVIRETNAIHENTEVTKACIDTKNKIVTTPAYMLANSISEVAKGANAMVKAMIELARQH